MRSIVVEPRQEILPPKPRKLPLRTACSHLCSMQPTLRFLKSLLPPVDRLLQPINVSFELRRLHREKGERQLVLASFDGHVCERLLLFAYASLQKVDIHA